MSAPTSVIPGILTTLDQWYGFKRVDTPLLLSAGRHLAFSVETDRGTRLVKIARDATEAEQIAREANALRCFADVAVGLVPTIDLTVAGDVLSSAEGESVLIVREYVRGRVLAEDRRGFAECGRWLGRLHLVLAGIATEALGNRAIRKLDPMGEVLKLRGELGSLPLTTGQHARLGTICGRLQERLGELSAEVLSHPGVGHGDSHPQNLLVRRNAWPCWIDFEDSYVGPQVYDLATLVWSSFRHRRTQELWGSALAGYNACVELDPYTLQAIPPMTLLRHLWWLAIQNEHGRHHFASGDDREEFLQGGFALADCIAEDACGI